MSTTPNVRFTVTASGQESAFLSVIETRTGKLRLILRSGTNREVESRPGVAITQERYSIHDSNQSPDYSTFHYTMICEDGWRADAHQLNDAIKKNTGYAPIYISATSDLSLPKYAYTPKAKTEIINIGAYNTKFYTLCYGIIIGRNDADFPTRSSAFTNVLQKQFQRYNLILLWSFATLPASAFCSMAHVITIPPEHGASPNSEAVLRGLMHGRTVDTCIDYFSQMRATLMEQQIEKAARSMEKGDEWRPIMRSMTGFVADGTLGVDAIKSYFDSGAIPRIG